MLEIDVRSNIGSLTKGLTAFAKQQIPFATALALTDIANQVAQAERAAFPATLDRPTPFTEGSVRVAPARKDNRVARVFLMDRAASYLEPFEFGGPHSLGQKRGILKPVNQNTNAFGNLPASTLSRLRGKANVFIGAVHTRKGDVRGVWQRVGPKKARKARGAKAAQAKAPAGRLKLLVRFSDPLEVRQHLGWMDRAGRVIDRALAPAFIKAMGRALA